jgi:SSS family solute:Na+ symporter
MIPAGVVFAYLALVLYIGVFASRVRPGTSNAEDYFLAGRRIGPTIFLLSLVGTNLTAFSILGASGHAFANGVVTYGLMASSSALVIPIALLFTGTRLWALGKRHGFMTPVQMFRDRWECGHIGTLIFVVMAALLVPYVVIAVVGGGTTLETISGGAVPFWAGGAIVSLVVMSYVFLGGMRGTAQRQVMRQPRTPALAAALGPSLAAAPAVAPDTSHRAHAPRVLGAAGVRGASAT